MREKDTHILKETGTAYRASAGTDIDVLFLEDGLALTAWERIQANDDIMNFGESLRNAMEKRNAKPR